MGNDESDVLAPWGPKGVPKSNRWAPDILGPGFEVQILDLLPDTEGDVPIAVVRHRRDCDPIWATGTSPWLPLPQAQKPLLATMLYLHGRNDYFFNQELARMASAAGCAFYALDLRKYGRSLRPWQTIGYTESLSTYDEDIAAALKVVKRDHPNLPIIMMGHSTGGLIATLWANRHPGALAGLILNSAWLELQSMAAMRPAMTQVVTRISSKRPRATLMSSKDDHYWRSLTLGWDESGFEMPAELQEYANDPARTGWQISPEWKWPISYPVPAGWLEAILKGQEDVEKNVHLGIPLLSMTSTASYAEEDWSPAYFDHDVVLNVELIQERAYRLSDCVTLTRFPGKHDLMLSNPDTRQEIYTTMRKWIQAIV